MIKPKKSIENMQAYEVPLFTKEWNLKIDSNENLYGPSPKVLEAIKNVAPEDICFYPFYGEISQKIADYTGFNIDNIKVTNGADEAIYSVFQTYLDKNDIVLTVTPTFAMPIIYSNILGGKLIEVPYKKKWKFPIDDFLKELTTNDVRIVYLTTPNNPTGEAICQSDMEKILEASKDKVVLIDETYGNYCETSYKNFVHNYDNILLVKSFSKDFALAGLRLGYIISNEKNIADLKKVVSPYSVNNIATIAGCAALSDLDRFEKVKKEIIKSREILAEGFSSIGMKVYPSSANFIYVECGEKADYIAKNLEKDGIKVKHWTNGFLKNALRVTAPQPELAQKVVHKLKKQRVVIFDMDGVLIDAGQSYRLAVKKTFEFFAEKEISFEEIQQAKNLGGLNNDWDLTEYLLQKNAINIEKTKLIEKFQDFYWAEGKGFINNEELLIDKAVLAKLNEMCNFAVFTGRPRQEAFFALKKNGMENLFFPIVTMDDLPIDCQKPKPNGVEIIKNKILANEIFYIGDTVDDMICAESANVYGVGVLPPQDKSDLLKSDLMKKGAKTVLHDVNELINAMEKIYEI
ncbi:MAG: aminotransferase class I/II-fold pyridoxal phosphate-dependent enzyme [Candidatus Gastranaerophilales bacterium]|nr:aminotransferase class I/II-fold pyridoxal phosphate-dependent enzyme [Candidatus Gastranaerophilales bacterium]